MNAAALTKERSKDTNRQRAWRSTHRPLTFPCSVDGCIREAKIPGMCPVCSSRVERFGDPWISGGRPDGYWWAEDAVYGRGRQRRILLHRLVMSRALGRPLRREEEVHHRDGVKSHNELSNLELWSHSHPSGSRVEDKVAWALELLALYGEDFVQPCAA